MEQENKEATELITHACKWVDQRKVTQCAPEGLAKARAAGRLRVAGDHLVEAVDEYRKAGGER